MRMYRRYGDITYESKPTLYAASSELRPTAVCCRRPVRFDCASASEPARSAKAESANALRLYRWNHFPSSIFMESGCTPSRSRSCIDHILGELDAGRGGVVVTPNLDHVRRCDT